MIFYEAPKDYTASVRLYKPDGSDSHYLYCYISVRTDNRVSFYWFNELTGEKLFLSSTLPHTINYGAMHD